MAHRLRRRHNNNLTLGLCLLAGILLYSWIKYHYLRMTVMVRGGPKQTPSVEPVMVYCWYSAWDAGPILNQHWFNDWPAGAAYPNDDNGGGGVVTCLTVCCEPCRHSTPNF